MMGVEDSEKYVLDVPHTLISNMPFGLLILLIGVFIVQGAKFLGTIGSEEAKLIGVIEYKCRPPPSPDP